MLCARKTNSGNDSANSARTSSRVQSWRTALAWSRSMASPEAMKDMARLPHLDVLPEAEAAGDLRLGGARRLVDPGGARVALAVDHHVVELHAVRTFEIARRLRRLVEPFQAHRGRREILIPAVLDDVIALGDYLTLERCLHAPPMAALTLSGVKGTERSRTPVASNTALEIADGTTAADGSPAPQGAAFGWLISSTTISGMSGKVRIG